MIKLLSTIILILSIVLFPPSVMALVSNNAVPGDLTYPIKRFLESGIYAVLSLNPTLKAKFSAVRSERRFSEITVLLERKEVVSSALDELVTATELASAEIKKVNDPVKKKELINKLSEQIEKYDRGLSQAAKTPSPPVSVSSAPNSQPVVVYEQPAHTPPAVSFRPDPTIIPSPSARARITMVKSSPAPTPVVSPSPFTISSATLVPTPTPTPTPIPSPIPSPTLIPPSSHVPSPTPSPVPVPVHVVPPQHSQDEVQETIDRLNDIRDRLERVSENSGNRMNVNTSPHQSESKREKEIEKKNKQEEKEKKEDRKDRNEENSTDRDNSDKNIIEKGKKLNPKRQNVIPRQ